MNTLGLASPSVGARLGSRSSLAVCSVRVCCCRVCNVGATRAYLQREALLNRRHRSAAREDALKKQRIQREKEAAARRMATRKNAYLAQVKVKNDQFKLDKKIQKNSAAGKTTRI